MARKANNLNCIIIESQNVRAFKVKKDQTKAFSGNFLVYDSMIKSFICGYAWKQCYIN